MNGPSLSPGSPGAGRSPSNNNRLQDSTLPPGSLVGERYQIIDRLGEGGMGVVYHVVDLQEQVQCALKMLNPRLGGSSDITRFKREFRAASRLQHPNCVQVFALGSEGAHRYFTMEYVPGGSLDAQPPARAEEAASIALQTLAALDLIHSKQIVHRDIKPQNILLQRGAVLRAKLSDFGIAKVADTEDGAEVGRLLGSLPYLAPEQAEEGRADPRSDLYSFGIVLYQLLTGRLPFQPRKGAGVPGWLALHQKASPEPLRQVAPHVPEALAEVVMRLLEKDPERRFPTAAAAYDELRQFLADQHPGLVVPEHPPLLRGAYLAAPRFVGREREVAELRDFLQRSRTPQEGLPPVLFTVAAEAGIGKSRLVSQLLRAAQAEGTVVVSGTCRAEPGAPYEALGPLLQTLGFKDPSGESESTLFDTLRNSLRGTLKSGAALLQGALPERLAPPPVLDHEGQKWQFQRRIADEVLALSREHALLILLEDVHWADAPTLQLVGFLARAVVRERQGGGEPRVAFVLTHRPARDHAALSALLELCDGLRVRRSLELLPLGLDAAADLVASMLVTPRDASLVRFTGRILEHAGGNPLYLGQILHVLLASGQLRVRDQARHRWDLDAAVLEGAQLPSTMRDAIGDRAARLSIETKRALAVAAVVGRRCDLGVLQAVTQIEEAQLLDCMDEAIRAGFLEEERGNAGVYRLVHDRFRDAIYERLPREEARQLHRLVATYLRSRYGKSPEVAADLARHYEACGEYQDAYQESVRAAAHAMETYAFARSADLYEQALQLSRRTGVPQLLQLPHLIEQCGDASLQAGRYDRAAECFAERLATLQDPLERVEVLRKAADVEFRRGEIVRAQGLLEDVVRSLGYPVPSSKLHLALGLSANTVEFLLYVLVPRLLVRQSKAAGAERLQVVVRACNRLTEACYATDYYRASYYMMASVNLSERIGPSPELAVALSQQGYILSTFGLHSLGARYLERGRRCSETAAGPTERAWNALLRGIAYACEGDAAAHSEELRKAEALLNQSRDPMRLRSVWCTQGEALLEMGRVSAAREVAQQLQRLSEELGDQRGQGWALYVLGHAAARRGEREVAKATLREAMVACERHDRTYGLTAQAYLVLELLQEGDLAEGVPLARAALEEVVRLNLRHFACVADGALLLAAALLRRRDGRVDPALLREVERTLRYRRQFAHSLRYVTPLFLAGEAAWHVAAGTAEDAERGRRGFEKAVAWAERYRLQGALYDVHAVAACAYPAGSPDQQRHAALAQALRERFQAA